MASISFDSDESLRLVVVFQNIVCLCLRLGREIESFPSNLYFDTFQCAVSESHCTCPTHWEFTFIDFLIYFFHLWMSAPFRMLASSSQPIFLQYFADLEENDILNIVSLNEFGDTLKVIMKILTSNLRNKVPSSLFQYRSVSKGASSSEQNEANPSQNVTQRKQDENPFQSFRNHSTLTERCFKLFDNIFSALSLSGSNESNFVEDESSLPFVLRPHIFANYLLQNDLNSKQNPPQQTNFKTFIHSLIWTTISDKFYSGYTLFSFHFILTEHFFFFSASNSLNHLIYTLISNRVTSKLMLESVTSILVTLKKETPLNFTSISLVFDLINRLLETNNVCILSIFHFSSYSHSRICFRNFCLVMEDLSIFLMSWCNFGLLLLPLSKFPPNFILFCTPFVLIIINQTLLCL